MPLGCVLGYILFVDRPIQGCTVGAVKGDGRKFQAS